MGAAPSAEQLEVEGMRHLQERRLCNVCCAWGSCWTQAQAIPALSAHPAAAEERQEVFSKAPSVLNKEGNSARVQHLLQVPISLCSYLILVQKPLGEMKLNYVH